MSTQPVVEEQITALALSKRVLDLDEKIKLFAVIGTQEQYISVSEIGRAAAKTAKDAELFYSEEIGQLHKMWREKCSERASITEPAERIKNLAGRLIGAWTQEQERLRREEERKQEEAQRKLAEDEAINTAAALEKEGRVEEAEAIISTPVDVAPVSVASNVPRVSGVSKPRDNWKAEVTSLMLLVKAVAEGKVPLQMIQANESALNRMAGTLKSELRYPGVKVTNNPKSAFRS
jgi:hypothetical protein